MLCLHGANIPGSTPGGRDAVADVAAVAVTEKDLPAPLGLRGQPPAMQALASVASNTISSIARSGSALGSGTAQEGKKSRAFSSPGLIAAR